jgi:hypothetical protein
MPSFSWRLSQLDLIDPPVGCRNLLLGGETSINGDIAAGVVGSGASSRFCGVLIRNSMVLKLYERKQSPRSGNDSGICVRFVEGGGYWNEGLSHSLKRNNIRLHDSRPSKLEP